MRKRALLFVFGLMFFGGDFVKSVKSEEKQMIFLEEHTLLVNKIEEQKRIAAEDPYYHAQFNSNDDIRFQAVLLLNSKEDEWLIVQKALYDSNCWVRAAAVCKLNTPEYINLLWEIFWKDNSAFVRRKTMDNLVKNLGVAERDLLQNAFIGIILNDEMWNLEAFDGLDKNANQVFFNYLVAREIVKSDGYPTNIFNEALLHIHAKERGKLIEYIQEHFWSINDGNRFVLEFIHYRAVQAKN